MSTAARDLARGMAAAVHEPVALAVRNISSLGPGEVAEIRRVVESELRAGGQPAADIQLTISENLTQFLLVAEIRRGSQRQVLLESWPRVSGSGARAKDSPGRVTLDKKLFWEQDQPILDAAQATDAIVVLDEARVLLVRAGQQQSVAIPAAHAWPSDPRGRLWVSSAAFTAWLPGTVCRGSLQPLSVECKESQDPWLLAPGTLATFAPTRNVFEGHIDLAPGGVHELPPFYSAAPIGDDWVFAGADGRARVYTRTWEVAGELEDWGSDLAGIQTPCGTRILATRPSGPGGPDAIQPYDFVDNVAKPAGPALEFSGPITALWSAGRSATAVSRDLQTGRYAAYSLAPACGA